MSLKSVDYESDRGRERLDECPYCGEPFGRNPGIEIVAHLPCEATPATEEVFDG